MRVVSTWRNKAEGQGLTGRGLRGAGETSLAPTFFGGGAEGFGGLRGISTIQDELRKNGSHSARIETDIARTYFLIEIPCREGFQEKSEPKSEPKSEIKNLLLNKKKSELSGQLRTLKTILDLIIKSPKINTTTLVERSGKSRTTIQKSIKILKDSGFIKRNGNNRDGHWIVII